MAGTATTDVPPVKSKILVDDAQPTGSLRLKKIGVGTVDLYFDILRHSKGYKYTIMRNCSEDKTSKQKCNTKQENKKLDLCEEKSLDCKGIKSAVPELSWSIQGEPTAEYLNSFNENSTPLNISAVGLSCGKTYQFCVLAYPPAPPKRTVSLEEQNANVQEKQISDKDLIELSALKADPLLQNKESSFRNITLNLIAPPSGIDPGGFANIDIPSIKEKVRIKLTDGVSPGSKFQVSLRQASPSTYKGQLPDGRSVLLPRPQEEMGASGLSKWMRMKYLENRINYRAAVDKKNIEEETAIEQQNALPYRCSDILTVAIPARSPGKPHPPQRASRKSTSTKLKWRPPESDNGAAIFAYRVQMHISSNILHNSKNLNMVQNVSDEVWNDVYNGSQTHCNITKLKAGTSYTFRVCAINSKGSSEWSDRIEIKTLARKPQSPPTTLQCFVTSPQSILITWDKPEDDGGNEVTSYILQIDNGKTSEISSGIFITVCNKLVCQYEVKRLLPRHLYWFRVCCENSIGKSHWSNVVSVRTSASLPQAMKPPVMDTKANNPIGSTFIRLQWKLHDQEETSKYEVQMRLCRVQAEHTNSSTCLLAAISKYETIYLGNSMRHNHTNLSPGISYEYRIRIFNDAGSSPWSIGNVLTTHGVSPGQLLEKPYVVKSDTKALHLQWSTQCNNGGCALSNFILEYRHLHPAMWDGDALVNQCRDIKQNGIRELGQLLCCGVECEVNADVARKILNRSNQKMELVDWYVGVVAKQTFPKECTSVKIILSQFNQTLVLPITEIRPRLPIGSACSVENKNVIIDYYTSIGYGVRYDSNEVSFEVNTDAIYFHPRATFDYSYIEDRDNISLDKSDVVSCNESDIMDWNNAIIPWCKEKNANICGTSINDLLPGHSYEFRVYAQNAKGLGEASPIITSSTLVVAPQEPYVPCVSKRCKTSMNFTFASSEKFCHDYKGGSRICRWRLWSDYSQDASKCSENYKLKKTQLPRNLGNTSFSSFTIIYEGVEPYCVVNNLIMGRSSRYFLQMGNEIGWSPCSLIVGYTTLAGRPSIPPQPKLLDVRATTARIRLNLPHHHHGSAVFQFKTFTSLADTAMENKKNNSNDILPNNNMLVHYVDVSSGVLYLDDLALGTTYRVNVKAENAIGLSESSCNLEFKTCSLAPSIVANVTVVSTTDSSAVIQWDCPDCNGSTILGYEIFREGHENTPRSVSFSKRKVIISKLFPDSVFRFRVRGINSIGPGKCSEWVVARTTVERERPPLPPLPPVIDVHTRTTTSFLLECTFSFQFWMYFRTKFCT